MIQKLQENLIIAVGILCILDYSSLIQIVGEILAIIFKGMYCIKEVEKKYLSFKGICLLIIKGGVVKLMEKCYMEFFTSLTYFENPP